LGHGKHSAAVTAYFPASHSIGSCTSRQLAAAFEPRRDVFPAAHCVHGMLLGHEDGSPLNVSPCLYVPTGHWLQVSVSGSLALYPGPGSYPCAHMHAEIESFAFLSCSVAALGVQETHCCAVENTDEYVPLGHQSHGEFVTSLAQNSFGPQQGAPPRH